MNPEDMRSLDEIPDTPAADEQAREPEPETIERQIEVLRDEIGGLVNELDRRRHEALDLRLQLRRHASTIALGFAAVLLLAGGWSALAARQRAMEASTVARTRNLLRALDSLSRNPQAVRTIERQPGPAAAALGALIRLAGAVGSSILGRHAA